jgi:hypothetical protein
MADAEELKMTHALGELRGLLAAFAWANHQCNHFCTFSVENLTPAADIHDSLVRYFGEDAVVVSEIALADWQAAIGEALHRWLFQFGDLVKPEMVSALTDEQLQRDMVSTVLDALIAGLKPLAVWRVRLTPHGLYECEWDDFAIRGASGSYLLHLGVTD